MTQKDDITKSSHITSLYSRHQCIYCQFLFYETLCPFWLLYHPGLWHFSSFFFLLSFLSPNIFIPIFLKLKQIFSSIGLHTNSLCSVWFSSVLLSFYAWNLPALKSETEFSLTQALSQRDPTGIEWRREKEEMKLVRKNKRKIDSRTYRQINW